MAESAAADGKAANGAASGGGDAAGDGKRKADQAVAFHELFSFADKWDLMLMAAGSLGALAHGAAMPLFFLLFGDLINGFGKNQTDLRTMTDEVAKVRSFAPRFSRYCFLPISDEFCFILCRDHCFDSQPNTNGVIHPLFSQYALYFVYLGLVVCVSSYAGELPVFPIHTHTPGGSVPKDSAPKTPFAVFSDSPRLFSSTVARNRGLIEK
jgi:hypothetical protein